MRKSYILDIANTNDAASSYIARGWHPVPIPKGEKGPNIVTVHELVTGPPALHITIEHSSQDLIDALKHQRGDAM